MIPALDLPATIAVAAGRLSLRRADHADLDAIIRLLSDDAVSASRGDRARPDDRATYAAALQDIQATPGNEILLATAPDGSVLATFQLTVIPAMAGRGAKRLQVEAVRVSSVRRSGGIGTAMMRWVAEVAAPATGCTRIQLTSDRAREDAHRFYERLGYAPSHLGFKLNVPGAG